MSRSSIPPGQSTTQAAACRRSVLYRAHTRGRSPAMPPNPWRTPLVASHCPNLPARSHSERSFLPQFAHAATPPGLVAAYSFDENTGTTVADASGNGKPGIISMPDLDVDRARPACARAPTVPAAWSRISLRRAWRSQQGRRSRHGSPHRHQFPLALGHVQGSAAGARVRPVRELRPWSSGRYRVHGRCRAHGVRLECRPDRRRGRISPSPTTARTHVSTSTARSSRPFATPGTKPTVNGSLRIGGNGASEGMVQGSDRRRARVRPGSDCRGDRQRPPPRPSAVLRLRRQPTRSARARPRISPASNPTQNSVTVAWSAATDNVGVAGYGLYRDGNSTGSTTSTSTTFTGLACGTSYSFGVDAVDGAGNRSAKTSITAATAACPPAPDTQAPSAPSSLVVTGSSSATSVSLSWNAATDNVGVAGYGLYRNGTATSSTILTSTSFSGLAVERRTRSRSTRSMMRATARRRRASRHRPRPVLLLGYAGADGAG